MTLLIAVLIALLIVNCGLAVAQVVIILKFERLLTQASDGARDHFEQLRRVRQVGV